MIYHLILIIYLFFSCASQGTPKGGPIDKNGPILLKIIPNNNSKISSFDKIILYFNEDINSISAVNALSILNYDQFEYKVQGKKIIISPNYSWPDNNFIKLTISRELTDLRNNNINSPIHLFYNLSDNSLPKKEISGNIINYNNDVYEIVLYEIKDNSYKLIDKTQTDDEGFFIFSHLNNGEYIIFAVKGLFDDISYDIKNKYYGFINEDFIDLENFSNININILIDKPLEELTIQSFKQVNNKFALFMLSNGEEHPFLISNSVISSKVNDTITVSLNLKNRINSYKTQDYKIVLNDILDSIPPYVDSNNLIENKFRLNFSEPILGYKNSENIYQPIIFIYKKDSTLVTLIYNFVNDMSIDLELPEENIDNIYISNIYDYFGNKNLDTLKISIPNTNDKTLFGGNVFGKIDYKGSYPIMVKAENIDEDIFYYQFLDGNYNFEFKNINPGFYNFMAFEVLEEYDSTQYFNGSWNPFNRSAKYGFYQSTLEVRKLWDIQDMVIQIK